MRQSALKVNHIILKSFGFYNSGPRSTVMNTAAVVALSWFESPVGGCEEDSAWDLLCRHQWVNMFDVGVCRQILSHDLASAVLTYSFCPIHCSLFNINDWFLIGDRCTDDSGYNGLGSPDEHGNSQQATSCQSFLGETHSSVHHVLRCTQKLFEVPNPNICVLLYPK